MWQLVPDTLREFAEKDLEKLREQLSDKDGGVAYKAIRMLAGGGQAAITYLHRRLVERTLDPDRLKRFIADLSNDDVVLRDKASREFEDSLHDPTVWSAIEATQSDEAKGRARMIAETQQATPIVSLSTVRRHRAIWALELLGAFEVLDELSKGPSQARQSIEAKAAVARLRSLKK
ncbi:MAG TPA: hypothetical protein VKU80_00510 [Planctomycetota bacterium]|nr:hypothetical protein [Planctomycetota bacterium]